MQIDESMDHWRQIVLSIDVVPVCNEEGSEDLTTSSRSREARC